MLKGIKFEAKNLRLGRFYSPPTICIDLITRPDLKSSIEPVFKNILTTTVSRMSNVLRAVAPKIFEFTTAYRDAIYTSSWPESWIKSLPKVLAYILSRSSLGLIYAGGKFEFWIKMFLKWTMRLSTAPEQLVQLIPEGGAISGVTVSPAEILSSLDSTVPFSSADLIGIRFQNNFSSIDYSVPVMKSDVDLGAGRFARFSWGKKSYTLSLQGWVNLGALNFEWYDDPDLGVPNFRDLEAIAKTVLKRLFSRSTAEPIGIYPGYFFLEFMELFFREMARFPMFIFINDRLWYGWFDHFKPTFSGNDPFKSTFTLSFTIHPASGWLIGDLDSISRGLNIIKNDFGISVGTLAKVPQIKGEAISDLSVG